MRGGFSMTELVGDNDDPGGEGPSVEVLETRSEFRDTPSIGLDRCRQKKKGEKLKWLCSQGPRVSRHDISDFCVGYVTLKEIGFP